MFGTLRRNTQANVVTPWFGRRAGPKTHVETKTGLINDPRSEIAVIEIAKKEA